jgi:hypothetical protein
MLYIGICGEMTSGLSAFLASYDPGTKQVEYHLEVAELLGIPAELGEAPHSKIHYSLVSDAEGILYGATHCTGAPLGDRMWRPWNCWTHPVKHFRGSGLFGYDPRRKKVLFTDILLPHEGTRCMAISSKRKKLYGISYPRNHFFIYDLLAHQLRDLGRIGSINPQCIFLDDDENAYTTDDYGGLIRCDGDREELKDTGMHIPHASYRNGFHNVLYDVAPAPDGECVFGVTWTFGERLFCYNFKKNKLYDFGKAFGEEMEDWLHIIHSHVGGLVFGDDGILYFSTNLERSGKTTPHLVAFNPANERRDVLGRIMYQGRPADHISRAAIDRQGSLYFAEVGNCPTKLFKYRPARSGANNKRPFRFWG